MEHKEKKPYVKPMVAYTDAETGEWKGSPELIAEIRETVERCQEENRKHNSDSEEKLYILEKTN